MDENTKKIIKERFDALPESVKETIISSHYQETLIDIAKKYQLTVEQLGIVETETTLVMMGLSPTKNFENELTQELKIDKAKGSQIVKEINERVFLAIRDLLKLMYTPEGQEPSIDEEGLIDNELENKKEILQKTSSIDLPNQKEISAPVSNLKSNPTDSVSNSGSILGQKLSGTFQIPKTETDHSLSNMTKIPEERQKLPNVDPYREIPQ